MISHGAMLHAFVICITFDPLHLVDFLARKLEELEAIMYETLHGYFDLCQQEGVLICCTLILLKFFLFLP